MSGAGNVAFLLIREMPRLMDAVFNADHHFVHEVKGGFNHCALITFFHFTLYTIIILCIIPNHHSTPMETNLEPHIYSHRHS